MSDLSAMINLMLGFRNTARMAIFAGALLLPIATTGCGDAPGRTRDDGHGYAGRPDRDEIPPDDRRVTQDRPQQRREYRISSRDEPATAEPPPERTPIPADEPPPPRPEGVRIYVVQPKDTLWSLAQRFYGHSRHWRRIHTANEKRVPNPRELPVGIKLIIP